MWNPHNHDNLNKKWKKLQNCYKDILKKFPPTIEYLIIFLTGQHQSYPFLKSVPN
jgi:hypothetical protein